MDPLVARNFLIALLIGALIGVEREKKKASDPTQAFGGIRTYTLLALVGAVSASLSRQLQTPWILAAVLLVVGAAVVASYLQQGRADANVPGLTSEVAALAVCLLGALVVVGDPMLAVALAVITSAVLAFKQPLHGLVQRIDAADLYAAIKLLIASCIVLPLLPDTALDPWGALNPYALWLLVVLISALSLLGYVAVRVLGPDLGAALTGAAGGLVSSTATTLSFARSGAAQPADGHALSLGVLLSWLVMVVRVGVLVALLSPALLGVLAPALATMAGATALAALRHWRGARRPAATGPAAAAPHPEVVVKNPFSLAAAIRFGALFAVVMLATRLAQLHAPGVGVYLVAALAGLIDVDAVTLSVARGAGADSTLAAGALALTIALLSNTLVKCAMVLVLARGPMRRQIGVATAAIGGATLVAALSVHLAG